MDINAERDRLQAMRENPRSPLEVAFKKWSLDSGSEPREWSDETVKSAHYVWLVYEKAWLDASESLQAKVAELEIERDTFRHGHRIASDNCARLESKLAELEGRPIIKPDGSSHGTGSP